MENNLNENFILSEEQIGFIDDGFIIKQKNLKDVVEELVKQDDNNFKKKDVAQIIELYREIKRQKPKQNRIDWSQKEEELRKALEEEIKEKGENINIRALARKLKGIKKLEMEDYNDGAIISKLHRLADELEEYRRIKQKQNDKKLFQKEEELKTALKAEIKEKGKSIKISDLADELEETGSFEPHDKLSIASKLYKIAYKSEEYGRMKPKRNRNNWPQEQEEELKTALEAEIKKKGSSISINNLAEELKETGLFEPHSKKAIISKIYRLMKQSKSNQEEDKITENVGTENYDYININSQNNNGIDKDLAKRLEEAFNKCLNDTEQLNNTEDRLTKINTLENDKPNNPDTSTLEATNENQLLSNLSNAANSMNQTSFISTEKNDFNSVMLETNNKKENLKQSLDGLHNVESDISKTTENISPLIFLSDESDSSFNELRHPYSSLPAIY